MGTVDMDILQRSGYKASAQMAAVEAEITSVLNTSAMAVRRS